MASQKVRLLVKLTDALGGVSPDGVDLGDERKFPDFYLIVSPDQLRKIGREKHGKLHARFEAVA